MKGLWLIRFLLLFSSVPAAAQIFTPIDRTYAFRNRSELALRLQSARPDSNKIFLFLDIADAYLKAHLPDSSLFYSDQAVRLARSLGLGEEAGQGLFLACRAHALKGEIAAAESITAGVQGIWKMRMLQELAEHYSFRPGATPADLDTAWRYIRQLVALTDTLHVVAATQNTRAVLAKYYYQRGDLWKGMDLFMENVREAHRVGDLNLEAHWYSEAGTYTPGYAATIDTIQYVLSTAQQLFEKAGNRKEALYSLDDLAEWHWLMGRAQLAEQEQRQVCYGLQQLGVKKLYNVYRQLANYELSLGNHGLALRLILQAKKNLDSLQQDYGADRVDQTLANIYWVENDIDKSLYWYRAVLKEAEGRRDLVIYSPALRIVQGMIHKGDATGARHFLDDFERDNPPARSRDKELIAEARGTIAEALGEYPKAERCFLDQTRYDALAADEARRDIEQFYDYDFARATAAYCVGRFYAGRKEFTRARPYLLKALMPQVLMPAPLDLIRDVHLLLFEVDSATGDLASAIRHRLSYERYADSIFSDARARQIAELQIQYETENKDRDISLLSKQAQLQEADLRSDTLFRNIIMGGLLLTLVIIGLLYNQYRLKQKNNRALRQLLDEKEILLREVHHRVKNNLQMIVSLLSSQSAFLTSDALQAIQDSQNRVFSISLIHQKLYQSENVAFIEMSSYLPELVNYLRDIYGIGNTISFRLDIAHVEVGISQAVSIGLILNEALTNAIKHAFPVKNRGNTVVIEMVLGDRGIVRLKIADNGIGLPSDGGGSGLGLKLMRGLTEDLGGAFTIESQNGTTIYIRFVANAAFENAIKIIAADESTLHV